MAIDPQGRILVGGDTLLSLEPPGSLARYDANGRLDPTFGAGGIAEVPLGRRPVELADVAFTPDGRVLVAATMPVEDVDGTRDAIVVVRLEEDGGADHSFAGGELFIPPDAGYSLRDPQLLVHADGRVSVASRACDPLSCPGIAYFRLTSDGGPLGSTVTLAGVEDLDLGRAQLASDESLRVAARAYDPIFTFALVRLDADGDFAARTLTDLRLSRYQFPTILRTGGDRLLALGMGAGTLTVQRFLTDGRTDPSYAPTTIEPSGIRLAEAASIALQPDGRAIIGGSLGVFRGPQDWLIAMLLPDGGIDSSFGAEGRVERLTGNGGDHVRHVGVQPDGRIVVLGHAGSSAVLARYEGSPRTCGDADGDATLTVTDGVRVLRAAAELPSSCRSAFCDTDASGSIGVTDGVRVLRAAAALPTELACAPAD
jgi:uncharacterized delta-60 repeat protein